MALTLITPAVTATVTLEDARRQCRIHSSDTTYDEELTGFIAAAVSHVETITSRALEPQTWLLSLEEFDGDIYLPLSPVLTVDEITYDDADEVETTLNTDDYRLIQMTDSRWRIAPTSAWPAGTNVRVEFTAGYEGELDSADYTSGVPAALKHAILLLISHWFRNRQAVEIVSSGDLVNVPLAFDALIAPYKPIVLA